MLVVLQSLPLDLVLTAVTIIVFVIAFLFGRHIEQQKWVKIFKTAVAYRKGIVDISTSRAINALGRMGFTAAEAAKGFQDLGKSARKAYPPVTRRGSGRFPDPPKPPPSQTRRLTTL